MLRHLQVRNFAIVDQIEVGFDTGMTVLTGETGAGKSILVDALGLVLGERGSSQVVRDGAERAEFSAAFDVGDIPAARSWLDEQALDQGDDCLLRRVIGADGRSRAFINGNAATVQQLKDLGELLLDIHGQHFHQSLARRPVQRDLLDHFGGLLELRGKVETAFADWQALQRKLEQLEAAVADRASRLDLLKFQLEELDAVDAGPDEYAALEAERRKLQHGTRLAEGVGAALRCLGDDDTGDAASRVAEATRAIEALTGVDPKLAGVLELLESAAIQIAEANDELQRYGDSIDMDPARRDWVEERLVVIHGLARKHRVEASELGPLTESLRAELDELNNAEEHGADLRKQAEATRSTYFELARALSRSRAKAATRFAKSIASAMDGLGMPGGSFEVSIQELDESAARGHGIDDIEFLISANPGQPLMPLSRVASGGELSRMSLAIQVIASAGSAIPTMVFDEVDSGVGGRVAEMVGRRLRELASRRQVLCVTHLPQVASLADQHYRITKVTDGKATRTGVHVLAAAERVDEIARMLGGVEITRKTLEHAAEMLADATRKQA